MKKSIHSLITYSVLSLSILSAIPTTAQTVTVSSKNPLKEMQKMKVLEQNTISNSEEVLAEPILSAEINSTESDQAENEEIPKTSTRIPLRSQIFPAATMQQ